MSNTLRKKEALPEKTSGLGLENIRRRYELLSERKVEVTETAQSFQVKLPILDFKE